MSKKSNSRKKPKHTKNLSRGSDLFSRFAKQISIFVGKPICFLGALALIAIWLASGPVFHFSDTWQLIINTGTTIITFLMVFLIQNSQNRDSQAIQLKLDELLRAHQGAHTALMDMEELTDTELSAIKDQYLELASKGRKLLHEGNMDTGTPPLDVR